MSEVSLVKPKHLSASSINDFITNRALFFRRKIMGDDQFLTAPYFQRGKAIEKAMSARFLGAPENIAIQEGLHELRRGDMSHFTNEEQEKMHLYAEQLPGYFRCGMEALSEDKVGHFVSHNQKITWTPSYSSIPVIGYLDFVFESGIQDLKVVAQKPSELSQNYNIQGVVYNMATKMPVTFTFLTSTKTKGFSSYQLPLNRGPKPIVYWMDYIKLALVAIDGVYDAAIAGDVTSLIKHMSFPNLDAFMEARDQRSMLSFWKSLS